MHLNDRKAGRMRSRESSVEFTGGVAVVGGVLAAFVVLFLTTCVQANASMVVQPDGKILVEGSVPVAMPICREVRGERRCSRYAPFRPAILRFSQDGALDGEFGRAGAIVDFRFRQLGFSAFGSQSAGILAGLEGLDGFQLVRFGPDGIPDPHFGENGVAAGPVLDPSEAHEGAPSEVPTAILSRDDGKIVVGGNIVTSTRAYIGFSRAAAVLFSQDGAGSEKIGEIAGPGFGGGGGGVGSTELTDLAQQAGGGLVASAWSETDWRGVAMLGRLVPGSGTPYDGTFGSGGFVRLLPDQPGQTGANAVVIDGGRVLLAGVARRRFLLARFSENGVLDSTFGEEGIVLPALPRSVAAQAMDVVVQTDGRIVVAGKSLDECGGQPTTSHCWSLVVGRFNPDGSVDPTFGTEGFARFTSPNGVSAEPRAVSLALTGDGKAVIYEEPVAYPAPIFVVARLDVNGSLDPTFGEGGIATALPCQGSIDERRSSGCVATARVRLGLRRLASGSPRLRLRVRTSQPLDPIQGIRLLLPHGLMVRTSASSRLRVNAVGGNDPEQKLFPHSVTVNRMGNAHIVVLTLRRGLLDAATESGTLPRKLGFRVKVRFRDGTTQTLRVAHRG